MSHLRFALCLITVVMAGPVQAITIYVDQATGDDMDNGLTPDDAVATVTQGNALLNDGDVLDIGPGVYSAAAGETYPVIISGSIDVMGAGPELTILDGATLSQVLSFNGGNVDLSVSNLSIINGNAGLGGAININASNSVLLADCRIDDNNANIGGGIIIFDTPTIDVDNCDFRNNMGAIGGALQIQMNFNGDVMMTVTDSTFENNNNSPGSGIQFQENGTGTHTLVIDRSRFLNNGGTALSFQTNAGTSVGQITNSLFAGNPGTALRATNTTLPIVNVTFANNGTALNGGASNTVTNAIFWNNITEISGTGGNISYSIIQGLEIGGFTDSGNNIDMDPMFTPNFQLMPGSPAIDQGLDSAMDNLGLTLDVDSKPRKFDLLSLGRPEGIIDIGASEEGILFEDGFEE